jgi:hypothetical protein
MITWSVLRQQVDNHISVTADTQATIKDMVENDVLCVVRARAV